MGGWSNFKKHHNPESSPNLPDKIRYRLLGFTTRYTTHDATQFRDAWIPHTQTQRHGVLAMMNAPL
jgi:hypothetical protein